MCCWCIVREKQQNFEVTMLLFFDTSRFYLPQKHLDNELSFRGSNRYPHSLGLVLRLCLLLKIQPVFIPQGEPWRNGEIESFQDTFDKAFFRSQRFLSFKDLCDEAPRFEDYHNEHYIYSCLKGKTPNQVCKEDSLGVTLLTASFRLPKERIPIEDGYIHFYL